MAELTAKQRKECLYAQQGELDAVLMYQELAKVVKDPKDAETFKQLAAEEGRHASVFHELTQEVLKPKKTKAVAVPMMQWSFQMLSMQIRLGPTTLQGSITLSRDIVILKAMPF